jgi:hypothetical protein
VGKKSKNPPTDINVIAAQIVEAATKPPQTAPTPLQINQFAAALGRLGGLKGGPARAKKLSKKKRSQIAKKAAKARWSRKSITKRM